MNGVAHSHQIHRVPQQDPGGDDARAWDDVELSMQPLRVDGPADADSGILAKRSTRRPTTSRLQWQLIIALASLAALLLVLVLCLGVALARLSAGLARQPERLQTCASANLEQQGSLFPIQVDDSRAACSGNGIRYQGEEACACFDCWEGPTCATAVPLQQCMLAADSGTPLLFEQYWLDHPDVETRIRASRHLGYTFGQQNARLEAAIRRLHALVGNAVTDGAHIVIGMGSSMLINAAMAALALQSGTAAGGGADLYTCQAGQAGYSVRPGDSLAGLAASCNTSADLLRQANYMGAAPNLEAYAASGLRLCVPAGCPLLRASPATQLRPALIYSAIPYYNAYRTSAQLPASSLFQWAGDGPPPDSAVQPVIEFVTSPNNPDGRTRSKTIPGAAGVFDHAYLWPHYTPVASPVLYNSSRDLAIFTLSKLTGHAGSRIGWAITRDAALAQALRFYVMGVTDYVVENQVRAAVLLEHVIATQGAIFEYGYRHMRHRWDRLQAIFANSTRFRLLELEGPARDALSGAVRRPSPAYALLRCTDPARDADCWRTLREQAGVAGRPGPAFGLGRDAVRLQLLMRPDTFDLLDLKLQALAAA